MTRRIEASGGTIQAALTRALAELAGCDAEKVKVAVEAPGLVTDVSTQLTLTITEPASARATEDDEQSTATAPDGSVEDAPVEDTSPQEPIAAPSSTEDEDEDVDLDAEADAAADFIEGLLDALELPGDLKIRLLDDRAEVEVVDVGSGALIGRRGQTLEAIQELLRCALQREFQRRSHVQIDVEGYRARRVEKLLEKAEEAIESVLETGESERLEPMDVFERKAVHNLVAGYDGVVSRSQGREPARRVVIEPA